MSDDHNDEVPEELRDFLAGNPHVAALQVHLRPQDLFEVQKAFALEPGEGHSVSVSVAAPEVVLDVLRSVAVSLAADPEKTTTLLRKVSDLHDRILLTEDEDERDIAEYAYHKAATKVAEHIGLSDQQGRTKVGLDIPHLDALVVLLAGASVSVKQHAEHCENHGDDADGD